MDPSIALENPCVVVTGATGFVGTATVRRLLERGYTVRACARHPRRWKFPAHPRLQPAWCDMRDADAVEHAVAGAAWVLHLAAAKGEEPESEAINVGGAQHLIAACRRHPIEALVNVSTQSARLPRKGVYGRTKAAADDLFHASGLPVTTLRASVVYGDRVSGIFGTLVQYSRLPLVPIFGDGRVTYRPIHVDDLAQAIEVAAQTDVTRGKIYDVGGPDPIAFEALVQKIMGHLGVRRPILHIPPWVGLTAAACFALFPRRPFTRGNVLGAIQDVPMDMAPFFRDFGFTPRPLDRGIAEIFQHTETAERKTATDA